VTNRAALYLRSSKDRSDVSIDAQRRALHELAMARGLAVVQEFADAVESGKDDDRPGFQQLLHGLKAQPRTFDVVLALDTSRIARRRHLAMLFEHEAARQVIAVVYKSVPDTDPITEMLLKSILQAMDEWHSLTSRAKGLAGMAENVRQGWRAGGTATRGYQLEYHATGAIRDGQPVLKSKLALADDSALVQAYLQARAAGAPRGLTMQRLGITWPAASMIDLEWRALTYAGHTTWNVYNEKEGTKRKHGAARRPRSDWMVQHDTHSALITDSEAEALLASLQASQKRRSRHSEHVYLLTGLLVTPDGQHWHGEWDTRMDAAVYRIGKGRRISARRVDAAVLDKLQADLQSPAAQQQLLDQLQASALQPVDGRTIAGLQKRIDALSKKVTVLVDRMMSAPDAAKSAYEREIAAAETERAVKMSELQGMKLAATQSIEAKQWTLKDAERLLAGLFAELRAGIEAESLAGIKAALAGLVNQITLDPQTEACTIHYQINPADQSTGDNMVPRRLSNLAPVGFLSTVVIVAKWA
jgi:site-specific DNA recombinase